ncbi:Slp family lipoprotein, partial [Escherichia coli]
TLKMPAFEWVHVQLHQQKGMISLSPPTICNSAGPITGAVDGKIGNTPYKFMVMQVTGYKRWHLTQQVIMPPQPIDPWFYGGRGWPYGYGGWGWYNPGPARVQTVVTE